MTDAHCHLSGGDGSVREHLVGRDSVGIHPWDAEALDGAALEARLAEFAAALEADPHLCVGEIGLDRLRTRAVTARQRAAFLAQLDLAARFRRPAVLHGAKCWGQVAAACRAYAGRIPAFLFHGFSRSDGLLPDIAAMNGFVSVGPAVLNDHAVNYRALVAKIPAERLLVETDRTADNAAECPSVREVLAAVAAVRGADAAELELAVDGNFRRIYEN